VDVQVPEHVTLERREAGEAPAGLCHDDLVPAENDFADPAASLGFGVQVGEVRHRPSACGEEHVRDRLGIVRTCCSQRGLHGRHLPCTLRPSR